MPGRFIALGRGLFSAGTPGLSGCRASLLLHTGVEGRRVECSTRYTLRRPSLTRLSLSLLWIFLLFEWFNLKNKESVRKWYRKVFHFCFCWVFILAQIANRLYCMINLVVLMIIFNESMSFLLLFPLCLGSYVPTHTKEVIFKGDMFETVT